MKNVTKSYHEKWSKSYHEKWSKVTNKNTKCMEYTFQCRQSLTRDVLLGSKQYKARDNSEVSSSYECQEEGIQLHFKDLFISIKGGSIHSNFALENN